MRSQICKVEEVKKKEVESLNLEGGVYGRWEGSDICDATDGNLYKLTGRLSLHHAALV